MRRGLAAEEYAKKLIVEYLPRTRDGGSLIELFEKWKAEDQPDGPEEIARRNQETEELLEALNRNRLEMEGPGARRLIP